MKLQGFIGPAYTLDSLNVEAQRCVNLYPELDQSGSGKEGNIAYLRSTPGLQEQVTVGDGPIRLIHRDATDRNFVVSGNKLYVLTYHTNWRLSFIPVDYNLFPNIDQSTAINTGTDEITATAHGYYTGLKVQVASSNTLPTGLSAVTDYWVIRISDNVFQLASSLTDAIAGTELDISGAGTGLMTVYPQLPLITDVLYSAVNPATDTITYTAHALYTGLKIQMTSTGDTTGSIQLLTDYFVIRTDANNFKLATSLANAVAGTAMDITAIDGSTDTWHAVLCGLRGQDGGPASVFTTSTGPVRAASMNTSFATGFQGGENATIFVDGSATQYIYFDWPQGGDLLAQPPALYAPRVFTSAAASFSTSHIEWSDGYFIFNEIDSNRFWVSELNDISTDPLSFSSSEGSPDKIVGLIVNHRDLYMLNERSTEIYVNTGNADFPFERVQGGFLEVGCSAKYSIAKIDGVVFWLGRTVQGEGVVYSAQGPRPQRISTHAIEQAISEYADVSTATSYVYSKNGHSFYILNFEEATWVYDLNTGLWHERAFTEAGDLLRHRGDCLLFEPDASMHLVGDFEDGRVFAYSDTYYSDDGAEITRMRSSPHISNDLKYLFCSLFALDMEVGVGLISGQGSNPQVMLQWSDDGGHTWSDESWTPFDTAGAIGDFKKRVRFRRLGKFRDRVFRVTITDPVKVVLLGAHIELSQGGT